MSKLEQIEAELRAVRELLAGRTWEEPPKVYDFDEAAKMLAVSERTVRRLAKTGAVLTVLIGSKPRIPVSELRRITTPRPHSPSMGERTVAQAKPRRARTSASMGEAAAIRAALKAKRKR